MENLYKKLYEKNYNFYTNHPTLKKWLIILNYLLTALFSIAYILLLLEGAVIKDWKAKELLLLIFPPVLCFIIATTLRLLISRPRPYAEEGEQIIPLIPKQRKDYCSCPSRHLACAAVIAGVTLYFSLPLGLFLFAVAFTLGYIRFALGLHYPTDLIIGFVLGATIGLLPFYQAPILAYIKALL